MRKQSIPLYSAEQTARLDKEAIENQGIAGDVLMRRAGSCAFNALMSQWPETKTILVLCGPGNNGGDGYVIARLARARGLNVTALQLGDITAQSDESRKAREDMEAEGVTLESYTGQSFQDYDVIVDALLGIGLTRNVEGKWAQAIEQMNASPANVVALDIPSGLNADTGTSMGATVNADLTVTFIGRKRGLYTGDGKSYTGAIRFDALDIPSETYAAQPTDIHLVDELPELDIFKSRSANSHKGSFGHVLVIGGAPGMSGAAVMAATAAFRVGAGLVSIATHPDHSSLMNIQYPEIMSHGVLTNNELEPLLDRADVILVGPGLGDSQWSKALFSQCIKGTKPLVIDADSFKMLSENMLKAKSWVLTPHPGEAARLLQTNSRHVQTDRFSACRLLNKRFGGVTVLKGAGTIVGEGSSMLVNYSGNPGMATAGMGDVLSGIIAGLMAQNKAVKEPLVDVVSAAVYVHGLAADQAAKEHGERGLMATDLFPYIRKIVNQYA